MIIFFFTFVFCLLHACNGGSVLFISPMISASHKIVLAKWADALADRGHEIYWWAPAAKLDKYQPKNATYVDHFKVTVTDNSLTDLFVHENVTWVYQDIFTRTTNPGFVEALMMYMIVPYCESIEKNYKSSLDKILSRNYDFIIMDELFNPCSYVIKKILNAPLGVYISTCVPTIPSTRMNNVPARYAYMPRYGSYSALSDQMNLLERIQNTLNWWMADVGSYIFFKLMDRQLQQTFPKVERASQSVVLPDFQFICVNKQLEFPRPIPHNLIYIGGVQMPETVQPLNDEWTEFVESSNKGFILLAMGHWTQWKYAPKHLKEAFIEAFKRISKHYSVAWQYNDEPIPNLPSTIKLSKWIPQSSLLANPNCKLFITHAGCNGLTEALHYAVPMVAIPLFADQPDGAARVAKRGFGVVLHKQDITTESLYTAITTVLNNESYGINIRKFADNLKSDPMTPLETAVFWTEFAMRHNGGSYYKSTIPPSFFGWIKDYCIDFMLYISLAIVIIFLTVIRLISFIISKFKGISGAITKPKSE